jgi:hypothetical protein
MQTIILSQKIRYIFGQKQLSINAECRSTRIISGYQLDLSSHTVCVFSRHGRELFVTIHAWKKLILFLVQGPEIDKLS